MALLELRNLTATLDTGGAAVDLITDVDLVLERGRTHCVVGESGSGKTVTALSITRILEQENSVRYRGSIVFDGDDLLGVAAKEMNKVRGNRISMIFQEAMEALNPTQRIHQQMFEAWAQHHRAGRDPRRILAIRSRHRQVRRLAADLLQSVELPASVLDKFPHQLSGGMQQRVMIAMALINEPDLLIADEPTTALDVSTQLGILRLLQDLQRQRHMSLLLITHDIAVAAKLSDTITVMYGGRVCETGPARRVLTEPVHPYTRALLSCIPEPNRTGSYLTTIPGSVPSPTQHIPGCRFSPRCDKRTPQCEQEAPTLQSTGDATHRAACFNPETGILGRATPVPDPAATAPDHARDGGSTVALAEGEASSLPAAIAVLPQAGGGGAEAPALLEVVGVTKRYTDGRSARRPGQSGAHRRAASPPPAVDDVSLRISAREVVGVVGETGSGKSTLGRMIAALDVPTSGTIKLAGRSLADFRSRQDVLELRRSVQVVFQDAAASLDPRQRVGDIIGEPLRTLNGLDRSAARAVAASLLQEVGLAPKLATGKVRRLSGGQAQRVAIARAISVKPKLLIADEPTSALDVSVQGQIINLFTKLRQELGFSLVLISHNLSLVLSVSDRVVVMYAGAIVEVGDAQAIAHRPRHPYTRMLLMANPRLGDGSEGPRSPTGAAGRGEPAPAPDEPSPARPVAWQGTGCRFARRCAHATDVCREREPVLEGLPDQMAACHHPLSDEVAPSRAPDGVGGVASTVRDLQRAENT